VVEGMRQRFPVVQLPGAAHVEAMGYKLIRQEGADLLATPDSWLQWLPFQELPTARAGAPPLRGQVEFVHGEYAEGRQQVLLEILVLIVTEDDHDIGLEFVQRRTRRVEALEHGRPVPSSGFKTVVVAPFFAQ